MPTKPATNAARRLLVDLAGGADLLDAAGVEDGDAVGERQRLLLVVRDEEEGDADVALDRLELDLHLLAQLEVERAERLVEQQHLRPVDQGAGQGDALALPARELVGAAGAVVGEAHLLEGLLRPAPSLRSGDLLDPQAVLDVREHAHVREEGVVLEDGVDVAPVRRAGG